jgi:hypothetical protein
MKKIYVLLSAVALAGGINAQSITQAANEPTSGNINFKRRYDSTAVVPKNTGAGSTWNFSAFTISTNTAGSTYTTASSVPSSSLFASANLAEFTSSGDINYWKSATTPTTQFEMHGSYNPAGIEINFSSNPLIVAVWPIGFGSSTTDVATGSVSVSSQTGTAASTITTMGSGTGTLILPVSVSYTNVVQVKMTQTVHIEAGTFPTSATIHVTSTDYTYYNATQKYPLVTVNYEVQTNSTIAGPGTPTVTAKIYVNGSATVTTGINEINFDAAFDMFPNPAKEFFTVNLINTNNDLGTIEVYNELGQLSKRVDLGNESTIATKVSVTDLKPGVYFVKTKLGDRTTTKKLIIQ